jgi:hypothetical protein
MVGSAVSPLVGVVVSTDFYFGLWLGLAIGIAYGLFLFL